MAIAARLKKDELLLTDNVNERLPAVLDGLVAHYPLDGKGGAFDIIGGTGSVQNLESETNLVEAMALDWRDPSSWSDGSIMVWDETYQAIKITGYVNSWLKTPIVVDTTKTYHVSMEIMEEVSGANGLYLGGRDYNAAYESVSLNNDYSLAANVNPPLGEWITYRRARTGTGNISNTTSTTFDSPCGWTGYGTPTDKLTKYYHLGGLFNYNSGGIMYIRNLSIVAIDADTSNTVKTEEGVAVQLATTNLVSNPTIFNNGWTPYDNGNDGAFLTEFGVEGLKIVNRQSWCGAYKSVTLTAAGTYTLSVWVKVVGRTSSSIVAALYTSGGGIGDANVYADWSKQGEWQKITMTITYTTTSLGIYLICYGGVNDPAYKVTAQYTMPQIEQHSYANAFVDGSNSQSKLFLPISQYLNNTEGTIFFRNKVYYNVSNTIISGSIVQNNPLNGLWWGLYHSASGAVYIHWLDGSSHTSSVIHTPNVWFDFAIRWTASYEYYFINGVAITVKARSAQNPTDQFPTITLGYGWTSASGEFKDFSLFNKALSDTQIKALSDSISQIQQTKLVTPLLVENPVLPNDSYYFPLTENTLDITGSVDASDNTNVVYEDGKIWVGTATSNAFVYPTFENAAADAGWSHWGDTGHIGTYGQNTDRDFILTPSNTYSHWVANGAGATASYLLYQVPAFVGGYRSQMAMIKMSDGSPVTQAKVYPSHNANNGGLAPGVWSSIEHIGGGWYRCKAEGFSQDGSNDLVTFVVNAGYKAYFDHAQLEDLKPFSSPFVNGSRGITGLEFNFYNSLGLSWASDWSISYWKKPQGTYDDTFTAYNIESLGSNSNSVGGGYTWFGKNQAANQLTSSTPTDITHAYYFNHWQWISMVKTGTNIVTTTRGITGNLISVRNTTTSNTVANYFVNQYGYDFKMGGWDNATATNTYFRDLVVVKRAISTGEEQNLFSQMSIYKNKTLLKKIIEQGI